LRAGGIIPEFGVLYIFFKLRKLKFFAH